MEEINFDSMRVAYNRLHMKARDLHGTRFSRIEDICFCDAVVVNAVGNLIGKNLDSKYLGGCPGFVLRIASRQSGGLSFYTLALYEDQRMRFEVCDAVPRSNPVYNFALGAFMKRGK